MLITVNDIQNGDDASANLWNQRFATIVDTINGGLDSTNLASSSVATTQLVNGSVTSAKMNLTKSVDANGWTKYDYGTFQQYYKKGTTSTSVGAGGWTSYNASTNLPVGMSTLGTNFLTGSAYPTDAALTVAFGATPTSTAITLMVANQYSATVTPVIHWSFCITTS